MRVAGGKEYRANKSVTSRIDAERLFLQLIDSNDVDNADANLQTRLDRRIINNNETILKNAMTCFTALRFIPYGKQATT